MRFGIRSSLALWAVLIVASQGLGLGVVWFAADYNARIEQAAMDGQARAAGITMLARRSIRGANYANLGDAESRRLIEEAEGLVSFRATGQTSGGQAFEALYDRSPGVVVRGAYPPGMAATVADKLNRVEDALEAHPDDSKYLRLRADLAATQADIQRTASHADRIRAQHPAMVGETYRLDGTTGLLHVRVPAPEGELHYVFEMPHLSSLGVLVAGRVLPAVLVSLAVALGLALVGARRLTGPVVSLSSALSADVLTRTDHALPGLDRTDELGVLARRFAWLLDTNRTLIAGLEERNRTVEAANAAKSRFLATMSHEIRTPMNGVLGMVQLALQDELTEAARPQLEIVRSSGQVMLQLLNDILDISKLEAGMVTLDIQPTLVERAMHNAVELFDGRATEKGLSLTVSRHDDVPVAVLADPTRLEQVLLNLVGNAVKFTEAGHVAVGVEPASGHPGEWRFTVTDTGPGVPLDRQETLFQRFVQADDTITRRYGGTGLGLAICKELVETVMGGRIGVESGPDGGATFWFEVALEPCEEPSEDMDPGEATGWSRAPRVLVAEDNPVNQLVTRAMLERIGADVVVVDDGTQALDAALERKWDLLVLDWMMPGYDGLAVARAVRASAGPNHRAPIIALTANDARGHEERAIQAGFDAYLPKPVDLDDLRAAVVRLVRLPAEKPVVKG